MQKRDPSGPVTRRGRRRPRAMAVAVVLTTGALCAGLAVTALPAYADVTSNDYTIGTPSGGRQHGGGHARQRGASGSTNFEVSFTPASGLAGTQRQLYHGGAL